MRSDLFASPLFVLSLGVLVVNDWVLKPAFHNTITGKLSDLAGVALFALFWLAFLPQRAPLVLAATALGFAWWKSPLSQPAIDFWNASVAISIARTVDYSDLAALAILPFVAWYARRDHAFVARRLARSSLAAFALAAMMGTQFQPPSAETRLVWDGKLTRYDYRSEYIEKRDYERLVALLRRLPDRTARPPDGIGRRDDRGVELVSIRYDLPRRGVQISLYPDDTRASAFKLEAPVASRCVEALLDAKEGVAGSDLAAASDPLIRAAVDFRALPEEPWVTGVSLTLCDVPHKRSYSEALRYFFDTLLPPVEAALVARESN